MTLSGFDSMVFGAPGQYLQGPGLLAALGDVVAQHGRRPMVLIDRSLMDSVLHEVSAGLGPLAADARIVAFDGECTAEAIDAASRAGGEAGCDVVLGVGGGKTIDTAKGARMALQCPLVIVPTVASNDSPTSRLIVVYDAKHVLVGTRLMARSPDVVLVDTSVIARAPARFLRAGIGDAISKRFEVGQAVRAGGRNFFGGRGGVTAMAIAQACYRVIRDDARTALADVAERRGSPALERLIEACVLGSGLGFESGGLSIAHSMLRGFSTEPSLATALHGEQVAVGLLIQLCAGATPEVPPEELIAFYRSIGLPCSLRDLGCTRPLDEVLPAIVERTVRTSPYIGNFEVEVTESVLADAVLRADRLARADSGSAASGSG
ncbi:MAG: glycerol dehydrogenase [Burkholderiaceae bacterium]